ncbi:hypothetical protein NL676_012840 [Syzygium grande]|nr:hypothetical protein NL676_012840 [Syzygium grande]
MPHRCSRASPTAAPAIVTNLNKRLHPVTSLVPAAPATESCSSRTSSESNERQSSRRELLRLQPPGSGRSQFFDDFSSDRQVCLTSPVSPQPRCSLRSVASHLHRRHSSPSANESLTPRLSIASLSHCPRHRVPLSPIPVIHKHHRKLSRKPLRAEFVPPSHSQSAIP